LRKSKKRKTKPILSLRWCFGWIYLAISLFHAIIRSRVSGTHYKQPAMRETSFAPVYVEATPLAVWIRVKNFILGQLNAI